MRDTALFPAAACRRGGGGEPQSSRKHTETEKRGAGGTDMGGKKRDRHKRDTRLRGEGEGYERAPPPRAETSS